MKLWIARDMDGGLYLFENKPTKGNYRFTCGYVYDDYIQLDSDEFPEVTFENSPVEVELKIKEEQKMIDLNQIADACRKTALRRGQINERLSHWEAAVSLRCELDEYTNSSEHVLSEHLPEYTDAQEELADILIVCLTELSRRKVDIEALIKAKLTFNQNRE